MKQKEVKATNHLKLLKKRRTFAFPLSGRDLRYWLPEPLPVILVLYDAESAEAYWLYLQHYFASQRQIHTTMRTMHHVAAVLSWVCVTTFLASSGYSQNVPRIGPDQGQSYPDFRLPTLDGQVESLSDFRGSKVLLFHFASW